MEARNLPPDDMSWLRGDPLNWGADYGSQLSVFYALFHGWGDMVSDFLSKFRSPKKLQQWINEDKGETWEVRKTRSTPERIAQRLRTDIPRGILPAWTRLVTVTIDQQAAEGGYRVWVVLAHGTDQQSHLVDRGTSHLLSDVWESQIRNLFEHQDGGNPMQPHAASADSGWDTKATYDFCNHHPGMLPCKGSSNDLGGVPYKIAPVESGQYEGQELLTVNTDFWETDLQARLDERLPGEHGALSLFAGAEADGELLEHLCNATLADKVDTRGNARLLWVKKNESAPNDYRDAIRYGLALAMAYGSENEGYPPRSETTTNPKVVVNQGENRPDGRQWSE
jgi:phage terminase large subunit GpA-like protein